MTEKVLYGDLRPAEFIERVQQCPIAYLPLGTLEWHGEHLPLGADFIQAQGFFELLARQVGGIVFPPLFVGPDRVLEKETETLYGMDFCESYQPFQYEDQQLPGSCYWIDEQLLRQLLLAIAAQIKRAGFRILVAHGHGPSNRVWIDLMLEIQERFGLQTFHCHGSEYDAQGLGIQTDHAAVNETSLVMAMRPELVDLSLLPQEGNLTGVWGADPRTGASAELGKRAIELQLDRMTTILRDALKNQ